MEAVTTRYHPRPPKAAENTFIKLNEKFGSLGPGGRGNPGGRGRGRGTPGRGRGRPSGQFCPYVMALQAIWP